MKASEHEPDTVTTKKLLLLILILQTIRTSAVTLEQMDEEWKDIAGKKETKVLVKYGSLQT